MDNNTKAILGLPVVRFAPFFAAGLMLAYYGSTAVRSVVVTAAAAVGIFLLLKRQKSALCAAGLFFGAALMTANIAFYCNPILAHGGNTEQIECYITETASSSGDTAQYIGYANIGGLSTFVRLSGAQRAEPGDTVCVNVSFYGTDSKYFLNNISKGIFLSGYIKEYVSIEHPDFSFIRAIRNFRTYAEDLVGYYLDGDEMALARSLMFGDSSFVSAKLYEQIRVSGTAHYTAVSGAHFAVFLAVLLELFPKRMRKSRAALSLVMLLPAVIFFGGSMSVIRSAVMLALCNIAPLLGRRTELLNSLCAAVTAIAMVSPMSVLDTGFRMSVLGVFGVGVVGSRLSKEVIERLPAASPRFLKAAVNAFTASVCAVVCTSPICIDLFGGISLLGAITSIVIMPLFTAAMAFMTILVITNLPGIAAVLAIVMKLMRIVIGFFGDFRSCWLTMDYKAAVALAWVCVVIIALAAFAPKIFFKAGTGCFTAVVLFSLCMNVYTRETRHKIVFVSNGTSGAAVVCNKDEAAVFISGSGGSLAKTLAECLRENGATRVSCIAAPELDYCGMAALRELSEIVTVDFICSNEWTEDFLTKFSCDSRISDKTAESLSASGRTITSAKSGDNTVGDIILYYGYKLSAPENSAQLPLYVSSRQKLLPENGTNVYNSEYEIILDEISEIVINER